MLVHLGCGFYEIPAFGNTCPSKTSESYSWVLLEAGEEGGFLMWLGIFFMRQGIAGLGGSKTGFYVLYLI